MSAALGTGWDSFVHVHGHGTVFFAVLAAVGVPWAVAFWFERWLFAPFAIPLVAAVLVGEGAYQVWRDERTARVQAEARAGALDSAAKKLAWLSQEHDFAATLRDEIAPLTNAEWYQQQENLRYRDMLTRWETGVGERLRREFSPAEEKAFTRDDDGGIDPFNESMIPLEIAAYLQRRCDRLDEIGSRYGT